MENLEEKRNYLYREPIKGDVYRYWVDFKTDEEVAVQTADGYVRIPNKVYPDGSYYLDGYGSFFPETEEWKIKYQDSLSSHVLQAGVTVYFVMSVKRGKVNTRALVCDDNGRAYHTFVPTFPAPRLGQSFSKLRMDLEVVSLSLDKDIYEKVMEARDDS